MSCDRYPIVSKGKMPRRHIEIMFEDLDDNSSVPELEASTESDDDNSITEDNEKNEEAELNKVLYELHKKKTKKNKRVFNEVQLDEMLLELYMKNVLLNMKLDLMSSFKNVVCNCKAHKMKAIVKTDVSFTRFSTKYFTEVLSSLSCPQKEVIDKYGFGSLLLFDSNFVPNNFATWIAKKVNVESSTIVLDDKSIHVTKEAVHAVLGLPIGGLEFGKNYEAGRKFVLYKFGKKSMPPVKFFGDQLIHNEDMSEKKIIISFLIVALASLLCPNSSTYPSIKYLDIFEDVKLLECFDWSNFSYEWLIIYVKKFQTTSSLGGCLYLWAVIYLDHCDFGNRNVQQGVPRSAFWKRDMISTYTELDLVDDNNYGLSPLKDFSETCYPQPVYLQRNSDTFSNRLESALGDLFPENVKDKICSMMASHCLTSHITSNHSCQDIIISILLMLADSNFDDLGHPPDNNACDRHGFDMSVQSEKQTVACTDSTPKSFHPDINEDAVVTLPHNEAQHQCQNNDIATSDADNGVVSTPERQLNLSSAQRISNNNESGSRVDKLSSHFTDDEPLITPHTTHISASKSCVNESLKSLSAVASTSYGRNAPMKFRSRLAQFDHRDNKGHIFNEDRPSFNIFAGDDTCDNNCSPRFAKSHLLEKENEAHGNYFQQLSSSQPIIPFHCFQTTPVETSNTKLKNTYERNSNIEFSEIVKKIPFKDLTNSPDVVCLGESSIRDRCNSLCLKADEIYNENNQVFSSASKSSGLSSSGGKLPPYGPRRIINPAKHASDPFVPLQCRFVLSQKEAQYYKTICSLADSEWQGECAVNIDNVRIPFYYFGHSLKNGGDVNSFIISAFCRCMFHKNHPSKSKKNYFFPSIGVSNSIFFRTQRCYFLQSVDPIKSSAPM